MNNGAIATGIGGKTFEEIDIDTWDAVMSVNVRGTWLMTKAMAPLLRKSDAGGRIVNSRRTPPCGARRGCCITSPARVR